MYAASLSSPIILTALFIFGAKSFGDFEDAITGALSPSTVFDIVGINNALVDAGSELVAFVYESAEDAIEAVVDLVLLLPKKLDSELEKRAIVQFAGAVTSLFFLVGLFCCRNDIILYLIFVLFTSTKMSKY